MPENIYNKWKYVCDCVSSFDDVDGIQFNAFMERVVPQVFNDEFLLITTDTPFLKSWVEKNFVNHIQRALLQLYGKEFLLMVEVDNNTEPTNTSNKDSDLISQVINPVVENKVKLIDSSNIDLLNNQNESEIINTEEDTFAFRSLTFDNFVRGDSNRMAYSMAVQVADTPGNTLLNPLFIYGKSGLGKTHLMRAIQNYIFKTRPYLNIVYEDTDNFVSGYVNATIEHTREKNSYQNFIKKYEDADVLLIDDVQFLQNKEGTIDIIFQIFNKLINKGKQIVLSADRAPNSIGIDERYTSRFAQGGAIDIHPPELETKLAIVKLYIEEYKNSSSNLNINIPEEIQTYIAENSGSNIRELKSAVTNLIMYINYLNKPNISLSEAKELLENHFSSKLGKTITVDDIQKEVAGFYKIKLSEIIGPTRAKNIAGPRQVAMYLCRQLLDDPLDAIGKKFNRDHSTVLYSVSKIEDDILTSRSLQEEIEAIKKRINDFS